MANPEIIAVPKDTWTKVATSVVSGYVHMLLSSPGTYLQTYRLTGEAAPTGEEEGVVAFQEFPTELISSSELIDVYIYAKDKDGKVRVDI